MWLAAAAAVDSRETSDDLILPAAEVDLRPVVEEYI